MWPGMAIMSAFRAARLISSMPAVCAASTSRGTPFSRQTAPRRPTGCTTPVTLLAWQTITRAVLGLMYFCRVWGCTMPMASVGRVRTVICPQEA